MTDLFMLLCVPVLVASVAGVVYWAENLGKCRHKWEKWADPESTGMNVIQRRACETCNIQESRVVIANATITYTEEDKDVAIPNQRQPAEAVDTQARAGVPSATATTTT